jgi:hypothetical protein
MATTPALPVIPEGYKSAGAARLAWELLEGSPDVGIALDTACVVARQAGDHVGLAHLTACLDSVKGDGIGEACNVARALGASVYAFQVQTHHGVCRTREGGWESSDMTTHGTIVVDKVEARTLIRAMRGLGLVYDGRRMASLSRAIRSTPYMGGHIDLETRTGKPAGHLRRL